MDGEGVFVGVATLCFELFFFFKKNGKEKHLLLRHSILLSSANHTPAIHACIHILCLVMPDRPKITAGCLYSCLYSALAVLHVYLRQKLVYTMYPLTFKKKVTHLFICMIVW